MNQRSDEKTKVIICRCEEVSRNDIEEAIKLGARTIAEIRRMTRAGMGLCQGNSCETLIRKILSQETDQKPSDLTPATKRPPLRAIRAGALVMKTGSNS